MGAGRGGAGRGGGALAPLDKGKGESVSVLN